MSWMFDIFYIGSEDYETFHVLVHEFNNDEKNLTKIDFDSLLIRRNADEVLESLDTIQTWLMEMIHDKLERRRPEKVRFMATPVDVIEFCVNDVTGRYLDDVAYYFKLLKKLLRATKRFESLRHWGR